MIQARKLSSALTDYSATEKDTGCKWVDGKSIYKKTYYFSQLPNAAQTSIPLGFSNLDSLIRIEGVAQSSSVAVPLCYAAAGTSPQTQAPYNIDIAYIASTNSLRIGTGTDRTMLHAYVTIYYTKNI